MFIYANENIYLKSLDVISKRKEKILSIPNKNFFDRSF